MPRPARPWFRFYSETLDNRKAQELGHMDPVLFFNWVNLLCLANVSAQRGTLPALHDIAFALRMDGQAAEKVLLELVQRRFITRQKQRYSMKDWSDWNPESDSRETPGRRRVSAAVAPPLRRVSAAVAPPREEKKKEREREREREREEIRASLGWAMEPDTNGFIQQYRQHYEQTTGKPISGQRTLAAGQIEKEYGGAACVQVASALGWEKSPKYYVGALEDMRNERKPVGRNTVATQAPIDTATAIRLAYPGIKQWTEPDIGAGDGGLAPLDGDDDPAGLDVQG